ncbi:MULTISPECIES: threonine/serine exporter family protein [Turicibacter]|jgi:hypothetical protein|uniref:Threonine/serine exporter n=3 Tax=Turicibacter sanguinis TaxID=154288 RepID=A0A173TZ02_9FIRM|nr:MULTISPECIES: threonine/serine exporter family protein [Turicibacter]EFF63736.1 conserved hypothetical protein [Turicibacter sanguinis PC909]EGC91858.1 hypothetical protein HMPREF9402_2131 [Turicibacter sp. HGF1]MBP3904840.1 threonine/serine exporter family protein [Turicibacter sp.]MCU7191760.1 threonine/serine exporter family protein [Turicibacter sanguinis]MCU7197815.1 threonine/serine exporter family protein [Turicibacter sanguinis]
MKENMILIISATIESLGFALLFRVRKDRLIYGTIGGMVTITIYLWLFSIHQDAFLSNLIAGIFATAYSEIFARVLKSPAIVFLVPSVIPLVPGGSLYYAMRAFILNDEPEFSSHLHNTFSTGIGIAVSIILVSIFFYYLKSLRKKFKY